MHDLLRSELSGLIRTEKVLVILRDGRKLIGVFRSYDQFGKLYILSTPKRTCLELPNPADPLYCLETC